jgi:hypothetical protein
MTLDSKTGDFVAGEEVYFCFGSVIPGTDKGKRKRGKLDLRGFAEAQQPLKKATEKAPRAFERIECVSAKYEADETDIRWKAKVVQGAHRAIEGWLTGDASCTVQVPHQNRSSKS